MPHKPFTEDEIVQLRLNPYTLKVTENSLKHTYAFKCLLRDKIDEPGMTLRKLYQEAGYDPDMIGMMRMKGYLRKVRDEIAQTGDVKPTGRTREEELAAFAARDMNKQQTRATLKELQTKVIYLEQEIEFLKKISQIKGPNESGE